MHSVQSDVQATYRVTRWFSTIVKTPPTAPYITTSMANQVNSAATTFLVEPDVWLAMSSK
jgi:hypothetical protein